LVEEYVTTIELPEEKSNILENTVIAEPVQIIMYLPSSSDKAGSESSSTDDDDFDEMKGSATKTELLGLLGDNK
jgi:hypothetical protein